MKRIRRMPIGLALAVPAWLPLGAPIPATTGAALALRGFAAAAPSLPSAAGAMLALAAAGGPAASPVRAQETAGGPARERARRTLTAPVFEELEAVAREAEAEGVPAEPLFNKALEGAAKGVPADRLVPAVRAYAGRLGRARTAFGPGAPPPLLVAGADALQRGVEAGALRAMGEGPGRSPVAVLVLADLVESGVPADRALGLVREAMGRRLADERMLDLPARVRRMIREGAAPHDAAERVRQAVRSGRRRPGGEAGPPVPPGSEPVTRERERRRRPGGRGG